MKQRVRKFLETLAPWCFWESVRFEWKMWRLRQQLGRQRRELAGLKHVWVNLGAGAAGRDGWVNVDAFPAPGITLTCDCRGSLPLPDGCALGIFTEHFLEHVDYDREVPGLLADCLRILQPGGVIRIIVPDAERYLRAYCSDGWQELEQLRGLDASHRDPYFQTPLQTKMELVNLLFRQFGEHKFAYDYASLEHALIAAGFTGVQRASFDVSLLAGLAIDTPSREHESLYVEAVKPV